MKIYSDTDIANVEVLLSSLEFKKILEALTEFETKTEQYKKDSKGKTDLGFTHIHFKDIVEICEDEKTDIVLYIDLDR